MQELRLTRKRTLEKHRSTKTLEKNRFKNAQVQRQQNKTALKMLKFKNIIKSNIENWSSTKKLENTALKSALQRYQKIQHWEKTIKQGTEKCQSTSRKHSIKSDKVKVFELRDFSLNTMNFFVRYRMFSELTVGVLGAGSIGMEVARHLKLMGATVLGMKRTPPPQSHPNIDRFFTTDELDDFLSSCDYVCNVLPHTPATIDLLSGSCKIPALQIIAFHVIFQKMQTSLCFGFSWPSSSTLKSLNSCR